MALSVKWIKCKSDTWCPFERVNIENVTAEGVYIIWHGGNQSAVVRVGQGDIKTRLTAHRSDPEILAYRKSGALMVTWAAVPEAQQDGVHTYLGDLLSPLVGGAPSATPIAVSSPW